MSQSIAIPTRRQHDKGKQPVANRNRGDRESYHTSRWNEGYGSSYGSSHAGSPKSSDVAPVPKRDAVETARRRSLMSASFLETQHTVVNVGDSESPRLISCVKASQGFDWNQEIFLPPYMSHHHVEDLERKQDPVEDIVLTDEDVKNMLPS